MFAPSPSLLIPKLRSKPDETQDQPVEPSKVLPVPKLQTPRTRFRCDVCDKSFPFLRLLVVHKNAVHFKRRRHKCGKCGKAFADPSNLQKHVNGVHLQKIMSKCQYCLKEFKTPSYLQKHIQLVHRAKNAWACARCPDISFDDEETLIQHIKQEHDQSPGNAPKRLKPADG